MTETQRAPLPIPPLEDPLEEKVVIGKPHRLQKKPNPPAL